MLLDNIVRYKNVDLKVLLLIYVHLNNILLFLIN